MNARMIIAGLAGCALIAGCDTAPDTAADVSRDAGRDAPPLAASAQPDPSTCPPPAHAYHEDEFGPRTDPLVVPASIRTLAATDNTNLAITTFSGGQICKDVSWLFNFGTAAKTYLDGRFVAMEWGAFEAFGTMVFDRSNKGVQVETGNLPVFSPSNGRMAALQFTQSGFGGLENIAIWQIENDGLKEIYRLPEQTYLSWIEQSYHDFQIDRWQGETCLMIFAFADDDLRAVDWDRSKAKRTPFHAAEASAWEIKRAGCP